MPYKPDDIVRVIGVRPGTMIESYLGSEGRVIAQRGDDPLYLVELDVGRANVDRGGQLGPRFICREEDLLPEVTVKMIEAAATAESAYMDECDGGGFDPDEHVRRMYRAMRAARFER